MKIDDLLVMCWRSALRNRRRYKAVMIGITLGTAGFIIVQTMGDSVEKKMGEHLELLGEATVMKAVWRNDTTTTPATFNERREETSTNSPCMGCRSSGIDSSIDAFFEDNEWSPD